MKIFRIEIDVVSKSWETVGVYIEAERLDEAIQMFEKDPYLYDWDDWETHDSETIEWKINHELCAYDEYMTQYMTRRKENSVVTKPPLGSTLLSHSEFIEQKAKQNGS